MTADVYEPKDGWLFLAGGLAALDGNNASELPDAKLKDWIALIETRAERLDKMGIQYVYMPAPEKLTIYDNKLHDPGVNLWLCPALRLGQLLQRSRYAHVWLDIIPALRAARDERQLYGKTDSHWNAEGAFVAYKLLCERIGLIPDLDLLSRKYVDYHAAFDLGRNFNPPIREWFKLYDFTKNSTRYYCNSIAQYLESVTDRPVTFGGSHVAFKNRHPSAANKKILIFGDSFCSQGVESLTAMLAETVREVEFIWSYDMDWTYIERARPDIVIYEMAERNMAYVPKDDFSLRWLFWKRGLRVRWLQWKASLQVVPGTSRTAAN
jgi:alginate O-acetyltransferase complex protein AlgJ